MNPDPYLRYDIIKFRTTLQYTTRVHLMSTLLNSMLYAQICIMKKAIEHSCSECEPSHVAIYLCDTQHHWV